MKQAEKFPIIQDPENENLFYVCTKGRDDSENELSIIGYGKSKEDALLHALLRFAESQRKCIKAIEEVGNLISYPTSFSYNSSLDVDWLEIPSPEDDGFTFSAMVYCKDEERWYRLSR